MKSKIKFVLRYSYTKDDERSSSLLYGSIAPIELNSQINGALNKWMYISNMTWWPICGRYIP